MIRGALLAPVVALVFLLVGVWANKSIPEMAKLAAMFALVFFAGACVSETAPSPDPCNVDPEHPCAWPPGPPPSSAPTDAGLCTDGSGDGGCSS